MATRKAHVQNRATRHIGIAALAVAAIIVSCFAIILSFFALSISLRSAPQTGSGSGSGGSSTTSSFGSTTAGIDTPLNASALAVINNAQNSYFETAGLMLLNGSLSGVFVNGVNVSPYVVNGKVSVVYLGSITCIFCGENRWAMALALGRFGSFSSLYNGYSSFGDYDVPTLYWTQNNYTTPDISSYNANGIAIGNSYTSSYINFYSIEGNGDIMQDFFIQPLSVIGEEVNATGNQNYIGAYNYLASLQGNNSTSFKGTPYTVWGESVITGADSEDFGNAYPPTNSTLPLTYMTHAQVLSQLSNPKDQFAWREYAAADVYIAYVCRAIHNNAAICSLSAIQDIEAL